MISTVIKVKIRIPESRFGDGFWRMSETKYIGDRLSIWWQIWVFSPLKSSIFQHKIGHQDHKNVTNIKIWSPTCLFIEFLFILVWIFNPSKKLRIHSFKTGIRLSLELGTSNFSCTWMYFKMSPIWNIFLLLAPVRHFLLHQNQIWILFSTTNFRNQAKCSFG